MTTTQPPVVPKSPETSSARDAETLLESARRIGPILREHAGAADTSLQMAIDPAAVRTDRPEGVQLGLF